MTESEETILWNILSKDIAAYLSEDDRRNEYIELVEFGQEFFHVMDLNEDNKCRIASIWRKRGELQESFGNGELARQCSILSDTMIRNSPAEMRFLSFFTVHNTYRVLIDYVNYSILNVVVGKMEQSSIQGRHKKMRIR
jgi:hypothetical protein